MNGALTKVPFTLTLKRAGPRHALDLRSLTDLRAWVIVFIGTELGYAGEVGTTHAQSSTAL